MNYTFKRKPVFLAVALSAASGLSVAQQQTVEEVVVTGIRGSLMRAQAVKMDATSVVEAISAEDIGKLPDSSIAESLARLPGLAGERRGGRVSGISVRGFKEDFVGTTMNGREVLGIGDNRGVEYDLYPSEIMTGGVIYKSADAGLITQGIGGTVDLRTARPLDMDSTITINASYEVGERKPDNPDYDDDGYRYAFVVSEKFMDEKVGVALAYASTESPANSRDYNTWGGYDVSSGVGLPFGTPSNAVSKVLERDTISAVFQFRPNENIDIIVDYLDIDFSDSGINRGLWTPLGAGNITSATPAGNNTGTGSLGPRVMVLRQDPQQIEGDLQAIGINFKYQINNTWSVALDYATSETNKQDTGAEAYAGLGRSYGANESFTPANLQSFYDFTTTTDGTIFTPVSNADFSDFEQVKLAGPQIWGGSLAAVADDFTGPGQDPNITFRNAQDGFQNTGVFSEELDSTRIEVKGEFEGLITGLTFGVNFVERSKWKDNQGFFVTSPAFPNDELIPEQYRVGLVDLSWAGFGQVVAYDAVGLYADDYYTKVAAASLEPDRLGDSFTIDEEVTTVYFKADFEKDVAGIHAFGNFGLQMVDTDQSSTGWLGLIQPDFTVDANNTTSGGDTYTHYLPSVNLNFDVAEGQIVRFSASKTISRARLDQMKASGFIKFDQNADLMVFQDPETPANPTNQTPWSKFQGTPTLRPLESNNIDLAYEYYFEDDGYVSATWFHKDLVNWTREVSELIDFSNDVTNDGANYYIPDFHQGGGVSPNTLKGYYTHFEDGLTGAVKGWEFTANVPLRMAAEVLDGFGVAASATFIDAKMEDGSTIPGQSNESYSLTMYYEWNGLEIRLAGTKRGAFTTYQRGGSNKIEEATRSGVELWDAQISYDFTESPIDALAGLRVSLQGTNLTDEDEEDVGDLGLVTRRQQFGPTYALSLNYSF